MDGTITWRPLTAWPAGRPLTPSYQREDAKFKQEAKRVLGAHFGVSL